MRNAIEADYVVYAKMCMLTLKTYHIGTYNLCIVQNGIVQKFSVKMNIDWIALKSDLKTNRLQFSFHIRQNLSKFSSRISPFCIIPFRFDRTN